MSIALKQVFNKDKTFRPKRKFEPGTQRFELHKRAQASLNSGVDLKAAVQLPNGEDLNDWVAVHVVDFFNRINLIYGTICEFCTERTCPVMSGGPKYEYRWQDDLKYKKPTALPAPQYMNLLMDWIEVQINNEDIFPTSVEGRKLPDMSIALKQVFNKDKTFRPKRKFEPGTQRFELHKRAQASLNSGVDLKAAVQLPNGEDLNDWVAVHVVDFFNRINLIYGTICEFCTERTCPVMSGGPKYEYRWQDDLKYKKPTALPAPQYMNLLMDWIEVQINNEDIFPTSVGIRERRVYQREVQRRSGLSEHLLLLTHRNDWRMRAGPGTGIEVLIAEW
ncbi:Mps one binder kinase activator-like 2B [Chelonia mydas]|uniref:Mps one binder kinase activator-like 2B n=1 Tax=Chelonia mydas TaxID=8469 RepID=M7BR01_CHEMY|nr:Mps one binder kinase activator-like 2B [Chelonia mydas]